MRYASTYSRTSHYAPDTLARPGHWAQDAACVTGPYEADLWFAEGHDATARADREQAKRVCRRCPASPDCLTAALERGERFGVWGGLDEEERRGLLLLPAGRAKTAKTPAEETADGPPAEHAATA